MTGRTHLPATLLTALLLTAGTLLLVPQPAAAETHVNKTLGLLHPAWAQSTCFFFTLQGVAQADPAASGNLFAVAPDNPGYDNTFNLLVTIKQKGLTNNVTVATTGNLVCGGFAEVRYVFVSG
jgi:hypothetical protein